MEKNTESRGNCVFKDSGNRELAHLSNRKNFSTTGIKVKGGLRAWWQRPTCNPSSHNHV